MIRENGSISGIQIGDTEHKFAQHADDTTVFIKDKASIKKRRGREVCFAKPELKMHRV